jgi:hypothetical protein
MNEFLERPKQRKLVQWAIAYSSAAFALLQGIDMFNVFAVPLCRGLCLSRHATEVTNG